MKSLCVKKSKIKGIVYISGSKNASLPIICAAMLNEKETILENIPDIADIRLLLDILKDLNCNISFENGILKLKPSLIKKSLLHPNTKKFRASYYLMGVYLALFKEVEIYIPGGCAIGSRPIDFHLRGFEQLGCTVELNNNIVKIKADNLGPSIITLPKKSLGATVNLVLLATKIEGETIIKNISIEPEIIDFIRFLKKIGVDIRRQKEEVIINGRNSGLGKNLIYKVIPDRIEAATYITMGLLSGDITVKGINPYHLKNFTSPLIKAGAKIEVFKNEIIVRQSRINQMKIEIGDYPKFSTDLQPLLLPLLALGNQDSIIRETIYENRFNVAHELNKLGTKIDVKDNVAYIKGNCVLIGSEVVPCDLRAGASLLLAGIASKGQTIIKGLDNLERGYSNLYEKLRNLGVKFQIIEINDSCNSKNGML